MKKTQVAEKILSLGNELFQKSTSNLSVKDLYTHYEMSSIDVLEFMLSIENEFNFEFDDNYLDGEILKDIDLLIDYIQNNVSDGE